MFKTTRCSFMSTYMNSIEITNQKPTIAAQKLKRKEHSIPLKKIIKLQGKKPKEVQGKVF